MSFLASLNHSVLVCKMGNNNTDDGDGEDGMTSPDFESGHSRHSRRGSRYNDLIALGAKSLWFQQPSLDRVTAAILSPGLQWIPSLISQVTSCEVSATHSSSSFSPGPGPAHLPFWAPALPHSNQPCTSLLPSPSLSEPLQPVSSSRTLLGSRGLV